MAGTEACFGVAHIQPDFGQILGSSPIICWVGTFGIKVSVAYTAVSISLEKNARVLSGF